MGTQQTAISNKLVQNLVYLSLGKPFKRTNVINSKFSQIAHLDHHHPEHIMSRIQNIPYCYIDDSSINFQTKPVGRVAYTVNFQTIPNFSFALNFVQMNLDNTTFTMLANVKTENDGGYFNVRGKLVHVNLHYCFVHTLPGMSIKTYTVLYITTIVKTHAQFLKLL